MLNLTVSWRRGFDSMWMANRIIIHWLSHKRKGIKNPLVRIVYVKLDTLLWVLSNIVMYKVVVAMQQAWKQVVTPNIQYTITWKSQHDHWHKQTTTLKADNNGSDLDWHWSNTVSIGPVLACLQVKYHSQLKQNWSSTLRHSNNRNWYYHYLHTWSNRQN